MINFVGHGLGSFFHLRMQGLPETIKLVRLYQLNYIYNLVFIQADGYAWRVH
jgi:hypothetical protein